MTQAAYLLARLPQLSPTMQRVPIDAEQFGNLLVDGWLRTWAGGLLDWLRIANQHSIAHRLPAPYPDAAPVPHLPWGDDPWREYQLFFSSLVAPAVLRDWLAEDAAVVAARRGRTAARALHPQLAGLVGPPDGDLEAGMRRDATLLAFAFRWLDQRLLGSPPTGTERVLAYAVKLLLLMRAGRTTERHHGN